MHTAIGRIPDIYCLLLVVQSASHSGTIFIRLYQIITDFQNYFTVGIRRKFVIILW